MALAAALAGLGDRLVGRLVSFLFGVLRPTDPDRATEICGADSPQAAQTSAQSPFSLLSAREREVMRLLIEGLHNRRIAKELGISPRTVEVHKARVLDKLAVKNVVELVRLVDKARP